MKNPAAMTDEELMKLARKRVKAKQGFRIHLSAYILVSILLLVIFFCTSTSYFWPVWPLAGWGIGIVFHALAVFTNVFHADNQGKVMKEYEKLKQAAAPPAGKDA